jgi:putative holliday junction resolvase
MKRMGIDFGTKKVGLAISDDSGVMAFPYAVVPNDTNLLKYIEDLVNKRSVKEIVIGHSLNNQGDPNKVHSVVEEFMTDLTLRIGIPIHMEPEQYSTQQAIHIQGKNNMVDASAASIILDSYINKQKNK